MICIFSDLLGHVKQVFNSAAIIIIIIIIIQLLISCNWNIHIACLI